MITLLALSLFGCQEYTATLSQTGVTPMPVLIGANVEMPAGILATVVPIVERDGEEFDASVELESMDERTVVVEPVESEVDDEWAILAVAPGVADILVVIDDEHEIPINVLILEQ